MSSSTAASEARRSALRAVVALLTLIGYQACAHWVVLAAASGPITALGPLLPPAAVAVAMT